MKKSNRFRTLTIVTLATAQCLALSACGKRAMLAKPPGDTGPGAPLLSPPSTDAGKMEQPAYEFSKSIKRILVVLSPTSLVLSFAHRDSSGTLADGITMSAGLTEAVAQGGTDLNTDPIGGGGYSAHIACEDAACAKAALLITEHKGSSQASITVTQRPLRSPVVKIVGTPKDLQSKVAAVLASSAATPDSSLHAIIAKVENGETHFHITCHVPAEGAVTKRSLAISGTLGEHVTMSLLYKDQADDAQTGEAGEIAGAASIGNDGNIVIELAGDNDRIQSITFAAEDTRTK
jgi:hypothetical protein